MNGRCPVRFRPTNPKRQRESALPRPRWLREDPDLPAEEIEQPRICAGRKDSSCFDHRDKEKFWAEK
jgi:hypothetical protein